MGPVALSYTLATMATFAICAFARSVTPDAERVARAAAWVALLTGISRLISYFADPPWSMVHYPAEDLLMMTLAFGWWQVRGERWAMVLALLFLSQLFLHALYWFDGTSSLRGYIYANNACFAAQLTTLAVAGGGHALAWICDRLRMLRGRFGGGVWVHEAAQ